MVLVLAVLLLLASPGLGAKLSFSTASQPQRGQANRLSRDETVEKITRKVC
jgi:hypothetical protein